QGHVRAGAELAAPLPVADVLHGVLGQVAAERLEDVRIADACRETAPMVGGQGGTPARVDAVLLVHAGVERAGDHRQHAVVAATALHARQHGLALGRV